MKCKNIEIKSSIDNKVKSLIGMDLCLKDNPHTILIIVPKIVLIQNWKNEFKKWGNDRFLDSVTFSTYAGLHKIQGHFDCIICDEAHHITSRVQGLLSCMTYDHIIMLSATVKKDLRKELYNLFPDLYCYTVSTRNAIENNILPDPKVYLIPLSLNAVLPTETIVKHPKGGKKLTCSYAERWKWLKNKNIRLTIRCSQSQKNFELSQEITYWKNKYMQTRQEMFKTKWINLAGVRLKWLSDIKNDTILTILSHFKGDRILTFCNSIEQTEILGKNCINSMNKDSYSILEKFNKGRINHITTCNMLNEGVNLTDCRIGIYASLNSSEIVIKQKLGRIL